MKCGEHAAMIAALVPEEKMGPNLKPFYEKLKAAGEEECIQAESQIVFAFRTLYTKDVQGLPPEEES